jgi:translation elongation factor P/translation initiation factor 5A
MAAANEPKVPRFPIEAHHVKKNKMVMLKGRPCKIAEVKTSKTGKHGHMKCNITGIDVLTNKKYNDVVPGHANMTEFKLDKGEYMVTDVSGDDNEGWTVTTLDKDNTERVFKLDKENPIHQALIKEVKAEKPITVTVLCAPVEVSPDKFEDVELVETFKEDKAEEGK